MQARVFEHKDQLAFAQLSGDFNPIHLDAKAARRLIFGRTVVHGVHAALWAFECWLRGRDAPIQLRTIKIDFHRPIGVGDTIRYTEHGVRCDGTAITLYVNTTKTTEIEIDCETRSSSDGLSEMLPPQQTQRRCVDRSASGLEGCEGKLDLFLDYGALSDLYPRIAEVIPGWQIATLLATTRLVGTECPGLHSIYSKLSLKFQNAEEMTSSLSYAVTRYDKRFRFVGIRIASQAVEGNIQAFERPKPIDQAAVSEIIRLIEPGEFAGQRPLVVGGSRGIGETTAKLLAVGGADIRITFCQGAEDAARVVEELRQFGASVGCVPLDVTQINSNWNSCLKEWRPTEFFYFASPHIETTREKRFSSVVYDRFAAYYVVGFANCFYQIYQKHLRRAFYPSSVYVDEKPPNLLEYVVSKMAGEALCSSLQNLHTDMLFYQPRLPRVRTDQTATLAPSNEEDSAALMITHLRRMRDLHFSVDNV